jgi:hypothetical protein
MKSILSLALLVGLGLSATAVQANVTSPSCGASTFPATGQTTSFPPTLKTTDAPVRDDGVVRAGGALRYQNNGDGTITDLNTGLMWEQKIRDIVTAQGNHDVTRTFPWDSVAPTIWDWLEQVNTEGGTGLGGHNDWRIPNKKELESIVDAGTIDPAVDPAFNNGPGIGPCSVAECSLTANSATATGFTGFGFYWSSTTDPFSTSRAFTVRFLDGEVNALTKSAFTFFVRAVRGGCLP